MVPSKTKKGQLDHTRPVGEIAREAVAEAQEWNTQVILAARVGATDPRLGGVGPPLPAPSTSGPTAEEKLAQLEDLVAKADEQSLFTAFRIQMADTDCGLCEYPDCDGYSRALAKGELVDTTRCDPGGEEAEAGIQQVFVFWQGAVPDQDAA